MIDISTKNKTAFSVPLISLVGLLLYLNFAPQRIELYLTEKLGQFPFPFLWLSVSLGLLLLDRLAAKKGHLFDSRMKKFVGMVCLLLAVQVSLSWVNAYFFASGEKGSWFQFLSMAYIYIPMFCAVYAYLIIDTMDRFYFLLKVFLFIIGGQMLVGCLMMLVPSHLADLMCWQYAEYATEAIRNSSSVIGGTGPIAFLFLLSLPLFVAYYVKKGALYLIPLIALLISLLLTYSRAPLLLATLYIIGVSGYCFTTSPGKRVAKRLIALFGVVIAVIFVAVIGIVQLDLDYLFRRDLAFTDTARIESARTALTLAVDEPLLGYGTGELYIRDYELSLDRHMILYGQYSLKTPHNLFLLIAAENGFILLILWIIFLLVLLRLVSHKGSTPISDKILSMSFICSIVLIYAYSTVSDQLVTKYRVTPTFWFLAGLAMAYAKVSNQSSMTQATANYLDAKKI